LKQSESIVTLKSGNAFAFRQVMEQWQDKVYNTVISIVQNEEDAEDITQEVFVTLYERIEQFREEAALSTWLYRITVSKALDHEKRKRRIKHGGLLKRIFGVKESEEPVHFEHPGILLDNKEKAALLFNAMKQLPDKQRIAFTLHKIEGLSQQEIAAVMNTTVYAVESLQQRARNNLKKILEVYYRNENS
jgi:RNA polymerase sigma-70 factor (ECF subfamily)